MNASTTVGQRIVADLSLLILGLVAGWTSGRFAAPSEDLSLADRAAVVGAFQICGLAQSKAAEAELSCLARTRLAERFAAHRCLAEGTPDVATPSGPERSPYPRVPARPQRRAKR